MAKQTLTKKSENMSKWYTQVIQQAKLADYSPVKGCMVMRPNGYGIWESIKRSFDPMLKQLGVENAYFPLFVPMSLLEKEADHVEGFAPELAIVTHGGGEELSEKLAVRPTSETIMYAMYSKWISSHRDLPLNLNQWNNVVRWEKRTYFFLRTTEFLWQEAHTAHASHQESWRMVLDALESYRKISEDYLAMPVIKGKKSKKERFAGADETTTIEAMMPDGKALQSGTSHDLGQNFAKSFDITFQDTDGKNQHIWQTSYGLSTRLIGGLLMTHGDDDGIVLPPKIAPTQVVLLGAQKTDSVQEALHKLSEKLSKAGVRVRVQRNAGHSLGWQLNQLELEGYPLLLVLGERELTSKTITAHLRHTKTKETLKLSSAQESVLEILDRIQRELLENAKVKTKNLTSETDSYDQFKKIMQTKRGFIKAFWCENPACEQEIKDETKATTRCLPFIDNDGGVKEEKGNCIKCENPAVHRWLFAQAY